MRYANIKEYMDGEKLTETELAEKLGVSQPFVNRLKNGKHRPSPELAEKIERLTGIPFKRLMLPTPEATGARR